MKTRAAKEEGKGLHNCTCLRGQLNPSEKGEKLSTKTVRSGGQELLCVEHKTQQNRSSEANKFWVAF
eukprot:scaffold133066_cov19-Tisochrysis_lutea.AAC.1